MVLDESFHISELPVVSQSCSTNRDIIIFSSNSHSWRFYHALDTMQRSMGTASVEFQDLGPWGWMISQSSGPQMGSYEADVSKLSSRWPDCVWVIRSRGRVASGRAWVRYDESSDLGTMG